MALTYDVFRPVKTANGALVVNMESAGIMADDGNPAAANPLERSGNRIAAVVAYFPPTDLAALLQGRPKVGPIAFDDNLLASVSPLFSVDARDPPTLILHGDADRGVPPAQSDAMHAALDKVRVENRLTYYAGADHDFYVKGDPVRTDAYATDAMTAMVGWFESHLRK